MNPRFIVPVLVLVASTDCAGPKAAPLPPQRTTAVFAVGKDKVWPKIIAEVGLEYPVQALEKESGLITTQFVMLPVGYNNMDMGRWIYEPGGFLATWGGLRMNMRILAVEVEPGKTQVTINCHYEAFESNVTKSWQIGRSNGSLENGILTRIEQKL